MEIAVLNLWSSSKNGCYLWEQQMHVTKNGKGNERELL